MKAGLKTVDIQVTLITSLLVFNHSLQNSMHQNFINELTLLLVKAEYCNAVRWASILQNRTGDPTLGACDLCMCIESNSEKRMLIRQAGKISTFSMQLIGSN